VTESVRVPYYWKRGLCAGLAIGAIMTFLSHRIDPVALQAAQGAAVVGGVREVDSTNHGTPFGPMLGVLIFVLFCVMPGPIPDHGPEVARGSRR
jgi:hypothetical protein